MGCSVLERDIEHVTTLIEQYDRGVMVEESSIEQRLLGLVGRVSPWQWCIHGDTLAYRREVVRWLVAKKKFVLAKRFALCGRGDLLMKDLEKDRGRVRPMGCGAAFCPRCSRKSGRRHLARIAGHLSSCAHGSIWHVVLTQPDLKGESLGAARDRFEGAWKHFYGALRRGGLVSALATYHAKPSWKFGWHYHCHLVVEVDDKIDHDTMVERWRDVWRDAVRIGESTLGDAPFFVRCVADAGDALTDMTDTQMDFWNEPRDAVSRVLSYVIRDVLQGVETWVEKMRDAASAGQFCSFMFAAKRYRSYGKWRKKSDAEGRERDGDIEEGDKPDGPVKVGRQKVEDVVWVQTGSMDGILNSLKRGERTYEQLIRGLIGATNHTRGVLSRLRGIVQRIVG